MASVTFDNVSKRYPNGHLGVRDMTLEIADGELLVLVGPSGCGKSTALRSVAGLEDITAGSLRIGNRAVQDLPPKDRDVAMVFQNYALYPHMTVAQNIGFALKLAKRPKQEIRTRVLEVARSLQLEDWLDRKPAQLSGGQRQRVAMGRAIVRDPAVFLMDEPLSNLDAKLRVQVRTEIARLQRSLGTTTIYVTHDQIEAMTMGDRVAVMRDGMLQQVAPPEVLYDEPDNAFVATFIGSPAMSLLEGRIEDLGEGALGVRLGSQVLPLPASVVAHRPTLSTYIDRPVVVGIRPEHLDDGELGHREGDVTAPLDAHVERRESLGSEVLLHVSVDARPALTDETRTLAAEVDDEVVASLEHQASVGRATIIARVDPRTRVQPDQAVQLAVRTDVLHFFDPEHGRAIRGTRLPEGFTLGVATSAHQIEGGMDLDGGGRSIWDTFAEVPGAIRGGDSGSAGVDHRRRMAEDVSLLADLGIRSYRFSIAWPRVQPGGSGPANQQGLDFYRSLVDALHEHGIEPLATLYHWDLPQELEDAGGWPARDTAERFAEYAHLVGAALGEGVAGWRTLNEPWCSAVLGYSAGRHAPGRTDPAAAVAASHHLLLGHGLAVDALRSVLPAGSPVGLTINPYPVVAAGERDEDLDAVRRVDGIANRLWLAPVLTGAYPDDVADDLAPLGLGDLIRPGDLDVISRPIDALGLNYYRRHHVRFSPGASADAGQWPGSPDVELVEPSGRHTDGGWAIEPEGLAEVLRMVAAYDPPPLYVEECGAAFDDVVGPDGEVDDAPRQAFLRDHLDVALRSVGEGIDLRGFYAWTYLDNFEWAEGYAHRFGIVHVDRATGARTPKASARWLGEVARTRLLPW